ncbi:MAG: adenylate kinase [Clostridiales bacterium]
MNIILLGPPGAGKGTQSDAITKKLFLPHISTGDMFRSAISNGTSLGMEAKEYMDKGGLVPDEITIGIMKDRLAQSDCREGFLLDGFPRTINQAESLELLVKEMGTAIDAVLNICVPLDKLITRLTGRRMCRNCGAIYHQLYNPTSVEGVCDNCGGGLYQRSDDQEEAVVNRLKVYEERTAPLISYYEEKGLLHNIDGDKPIQEVMLQLGQVLGQDWK